MNIQALYNDDPVTIIAFIPSSTLITPVTVVFYYNENVRELDSSSKLHEFTIVPEAVELVDEDSENFFE